ncbi:GNAT family N-acetyltransferase [Micromonospora polyrhachis]
MTTVCFHGLVKQQEHLATGSTPTPVLRPRNEADLDECVRILGAVHERDGYPVNWPGQPDEWLTPPLLLASWVAELGGQVVGHVGLSRSGAGDAAPVLWSRQAGVPVTDVAVISRLFVSPAARGHGIGALLMARAVQHAQESGLHPVLDVVASDTSATVLYRRLGWDLLGTVDQQWSPSQTVTVHCYAAPA